MAVAGDALFIAQRLRNRLPQRDGAVFGGVVLVNVQIAPHAALYVNEGMPAELLDHMIEKADSGLYLVNASAIEVHRHGNVGFFGLPRDRSCAHKRAYTPLFLRINHRPHLTRTVAEASCGTMSDAPDSLIPYDEIVQEALRAVVGRVLGQVAAGGGMLPGMHHFYITFKTGAPGVDIPQRLRERFPDEMTIVLQNKFWDLKVEDDRFSVGLSFNQIPSMLLIPFSAITAFVDPAVDFGLQFQAVVDDEAEPVDAAENDSPELGDDSSVERNDDGSNVVTVDFGKKK